MSLLCGLGLWLGYRWSWYLSLVLLAGIVYPAIRLGVVHQQLEWQHLIVTFTCIAMFVYLTSPRSCKYFQVRGPKIYAVVGSFVLAVVMYHLQLEIVQRMQPLVSAHCSPCHFPVLIPSKRSSESAVW